MLACEKGSLSVACMSIECARGRRESPARPTAHFKWSNADVPLLMLCIFIFSHRTRTAAARAFPHPSVNMLQPWPGQTTVRGVRAAHPLWRLPVWLRINADMVLGLCHGDTFPLRNGWRQPIHFMWVTKEPPDNNRYWDVTVLEEEWVERYGEQFSPSGFWNSVSYGEEIFSCVFPGC